ncbi:hypothetical protein Ppa06_61080 [Planomonospora parontospora subsp. parontospora]|uniref:Uncharacterized protein n=2 Tax=Planomonospora parontospora TaxID=58119 RepID=A0AA37BFC4_9ACTN|nr:hypothetical protein [Planomonospora parontospora]GGK62111.1 hypothetical protein GCM10010126_21880 [Planomonospora parontospora]GII12310.1 hypothetical protein Ppa06_61080 [Planomonospora parontospora subsp. parontospora]
MGVLVDYFTADSEQSARLVLPVGPAGANLPYVDCKGWLDGLDTLAAELSGRDLSEFGDSEVIADDGESAGVEREAPETVAALAAVADARLREYADEELLDEFEIERITALRELAREAVRLGRGMYRWACA